MKIIAISDTHWKFNEIEVPECDLLIHAGDISGRGTRDEVEDFLEWYSNQPATNKILIAGNHDFLFENDPKVCEKLSKAISLPDKATFPYCSIRLTGSFSIPGNISVAFLPIIFSFFNPVNFSKELLTSINS